MIDDLEFKMHPFLTQTARTDDITTTQSDDTSNTDKKSFLSILKEILRELHEIKKKTNLRFYNFKIVIYIFINIFY